MASRIDYHIIREKNEETGEIYEKTIPIEIFFCDRCKSQNLKIFVYFRTYTDLIISYGAIAAGILSIVIGVFNSEALGGLLVGVIGIIVYFWNYRRLEKRWTCNNCGLTNIIGGPERPIDEILAEPLTKETLGVRFVVGGLIILVGFWILTQMHMPVLTRNLLIFAVLLAGVGLFRFLKELSKKKKG